MRRKNQCSNAFAPPAAAHGGDDDNDYVGDTVFIQEQAVEWLRKDRSSLIAHLGTRSQPAADTCLEKLGTRFAELDTEEKLCCCTVLQVQLTCILLICTWFDSLGRANSSHLAAEAHTMALLKQKVGTKCCFPPGHVDTSEGERHFASAKFQNGLTSPPPWMSRLGWQAGRRTLAGLENFEFPFSDALEC